MHWLTEFDSYKCIAFGINKHLSNGLDTIYFNFCLSSRHVWASLRVCVWMHSFVRHSIDSDNGFLFGIICIFHCFAVTNRYLYFSSYRQWIATQFALYHILSEWNIVDFDRKLIKRLESSFMALRSLYLFPILQCISHMRNTHCPKSTQPPIHVKKERRKM